MDGINGSEGHEFRRAKFCHWLNLFDFLIRSIRKIRGYYFRLPSSIRGDCQPGNHLFLMRGNHQHGDW